MSPLKYPVLRQTLIAFSFVVLMGLFFALNYFIIIPRQQQAYNSKVFRVLGEITSDFKKRIEGQAEFYGNNAPASRADSLQRIKFCDSNLKKTLFAAFRQLDTAAAGESKTYLLANDFANDSIRMVAVRQGRTTPDTFGIPIRKLIDPSAESLHRNLFDLILLIHRDAFSVDKKLRLNEKIIYRYGNLATGYLPPGDSLLKEKQFGQFSTINDLLIAGRRYKAFTLPFGLAGHELVLAGFIKEVNYRTAATGYSKPLVLGVVIILVFLILSLPLVKIYLSSRQERINTNDVRMVIVVITAAPFFFMLIASGLLVYMHIDEQSDQNLKTLHDKVEKNFKEEIRLGLAQLKRYDALLDRPAPDWCDFYSENRKRFKGREANTDFRDVLLYPGVYKNLDYVHWINKHGRQVAKWANSDGIKITYFDVSKRAYFQKLRDGQGFVLDADSFYIEPVISWSTGEYTVNLVTPSHQRFGSRPAQEDTAGALMIGLASRLYSVCDPVLPKGYQFCIIDEEGNILFHSETDRSLHENLFNESNANFELQNAVFKKDSTLLSDVQLFDRDVKMRVAPMNGFPSLYLVTYYAKRERNLFVYHTAAFTLLCVSLSLFLLVVLLTLFSVLDAAKSRHKFNTYDASWMQPAKAKNVLYQCLIAQQIQIVFLALLLLGLLTLLTRNGYWFLFQASMALPFYAATGYYFLANNYTLTNEPEALTKANRKLWWIYGPFMGVLLAGINYLQYRNKEWSDMPWPEFFSIVLLSVLAPLLAAFQQCTKKCVASEEQDAVRKKETGFFKKLLCKIFLRKPAWLYAEDYGVNYRRAIRFSIFVVAVLPVVGIMTFGLNEEGKMQIKAVQFYAAKQIEKRRAALNDYFTLTKLDAAGDTAFLRWRKLDTGAGIYLFQDTLIQEEEGKGGSEKYVAIGNAAYYRSITQFLFLPRDHADFFSNTPAYKWTRGKNGDAINLAYTNQTDAITPHRLQLHHAYLGHHFLLELFKSPTGILILLSILAYFIFHFTLIGAVSKKIFLLDYFAFDENGAGEDDAKKVGIAWVNEFYKTLSLHKADRQFLKVKDRGTFFGVKKGSVDNDAVAAAETENTDREEVILRLQHMLAPAYDAMWNALKPEEKYLLYDFALDGFTNYKNVDLLYGMYRKGLIQKKDRRLELMNYSFRGYLLGKTGSDEIQQLQKQLSTGSTWKNLKNVLLSLFFATLIFLFATQQDVSNKIIAIVSGLATLVPLLLKIFDKSSAGGDAKK